eukprot:FR734949.1.p2 GENE.FR734949.1~~FR734949.1.p2  ORF type:complete len:106 (-),score=41.75 FR734949.1:393-710(-)
MPMITPSAQLTLTKGNKSWSSTAVAAALETSGSPWLWTLAVTHCGRLFFFFFFFFFFVFFFFFCLLRVLSRKLKNHCRPPAARVTTPTGVRASLPPRVVTRMRRP